MTVVANAKTLILPGKDTPLAYSTAVLRSISQPAATFLFLCKTTFGSFHILLQKEQQK